MLRTQGAQLVEECDLVTIRLRTIQTIVDPNMP
jgi:hypothetical protein